MWFSFFFLRFIIGHICPEAQDGGPIALLKDGDIISINAKTLSIDVALNNEQLEKRRRKWKPRPYKVVAGYLRRYIRVVQDASHGCVCDPL